MPVAVHVPIRIKVDAKTLASHPGALDGALARGLQRAMARSREEALEPLGGYLGVTAEPPVVRWSGAGLADVSAAARRRTEVRVARLIEDALKTVAREVRAPDPLGGAAAERRDPRRRRAFRRYSIDSYEGGTTTLPVDGGEQDEFEVVTVWDVAARVHNLDFRLLAQTFEIESGLIGLLPQEGWAGLVVQWDRGWAVFVSSDRFATEKNGKMFFFGPQRRRQPKRGPDGVTFTDVVITPPAAPCELTEFALPDALEELRAGWEAKLRRELLATIDPADAADEDLLSEQEFADLIEHTVETEIAHRIKELGSSKAMIRLDWGDVVFQIGLPEPIGVGHIAKVAPRTRWEQPRGKFVGTGGDGGGGQSEGPGNGARKVGGEGDGSSKARKGHGGEGEGERYGIKGHGEGAGGRHVFPTSGLFSLISCHSFEDAEPDMSSLGAGALLFEPLIAEIAERLEMPPCRYAATFCINAGKRIEGLAIAVGRTANAEQAGQMAKPVGSAKGNFGHVNFTPVASPSIQLLRRLAQAAERVAELRRRIEDFYLNREGRGLLGGRYAGEPASFVLHVLHEATPNLRAGVGAIFTAACQVMMLQLLGSSAEQIEARRRHLKAYAPIFQDIMVRRLSDIGALTTLRDRLRAVEVARTVQGVLPPVSPPGLEWASAARNLADSCVATEGFSHAPGGATHDIVWTGDVAKIRDAHGFLWTRSALEATIAQTRGDAESIDPLIQQLSDIPETIAKFKADPTAAERILGELLDDMARLNREKQAEARGDPAFGLKAGRIEKGASTSTPQLDELRGIHLLAHQQVGEFFRGDPAYADGVSEVFAAELGKEGLFQAFTFIGLALLAVLCPPAAAMAGAQLAAIEVEKAEEKAKLYRALINPEQVLSRAEIEMERYIAYVGLALALLPEATTAVRAASVGLRAGARRGIGAGIRIAGRSIARQMSRQATEALMKASMEKLILELATNALMDKIIPVVIGPVIETLEREIALHGAVGGKKGALELMDAIEREAAKRAAAERPALPKPGDGGA